MPIDHEHKYVYIHIPKTGGSSIEKFLNLQNKDKLWSTTDFLISKNIKYAFQHLPISLIKTYFLNTKDFNSYFKFTFVRHPYDRCLSEFFWLANVKAPNNQKRDLSSGAFSFWLLTYYNQPRNDHNLNQSDFILDENGNIIVNFIGKLENINEDLNKIIKILNINKPISELGYENKNNINYNKNEYLTKNNKDLIYIRFKKDFEILGYKR